MILLLLTGLLCKSIQYCIYLRVYNILVISPAPFLYLNAWFFFLRTSLGDSFFFFTQSHRQRTKVGRNEIKALPALQLVILFFFLLRSAQGEAEPGKKRQQSTLQHFGTEKEVMRASFSSLYLSLLSLWFFILPASLYFNSPLNKKHKLKFRLVSSSSLFLAFVRAGA